MAKLIRDKETEHGTSVRVMSIDDYFQQETEVSEKDPTTGKMVCFFFHDLEINLSQNSYLFNC